MFNAKNNSSYTVSFSKREKNSVPQTKEEIKNTNYIGYCNTEWEISQSDAKKTQRIKGI